MEDQLCTSQKSFKTKGGQMGQVFKRGCVSSGVCIKFAIMM